MKTVNLDNNPQYETSWEMIHVYEECDHPVKKRNDENLKVALIH